MDSFTDDDLKRLKSSLTMVNPRDECTKALLARMEAAEQVILEASHDCPVCGDDVGSQSWKEALKAWRKAAGK